MMLLVTSFFLLSSSGFAFGATFYSCSYINAANCSRFAESLTCGSNIVTYKNKCEFSKAHCADTTIDLKHYGHCSPSDGTTPSPANVSGGDEVLDFFCTSLSHIDCNTVGSKVCGDNGRMFTNYCEFEKAKCTHRKLQAVDCLVAN